MRILGLGLVSAALVACLGTESPTRADDGDDGSTTLELIAPRLGRKGLLGDRYWTEWWYANRTALLAPDCRVGGPSARVATDDAARARARSALHRALLSKHELVASEAALALGRLGDPRDIATLSRIVADPKIALTRRLHQYAALGLGMLPLGDVEQARQARRTLLGALETAIGGTDEFTFFWQYCCYALAMRGDASVVPDLVTLRRKGLDAVDSRSSIHTDVLGSMCYALAALGGDLALPEIEEHLRGFKAPDCGSKDTSWSACHALARLGGEQAAMVLRRAASDDRTSVRRVALQALGSVANASDAAAANVLKTALATDVDPLCQQMAAVSLGRMGHACSVPTLLTALRSAEPHCRPCVAIGLAFCARRKPDAAISAALLRSLEEKTANETDKSAFALACGLAGVEDARARVTQLARQSTIDIVVEQSAFALGLLGAGAEERDLLHELVDTRHNVNIVREAALALGMLHDPRIVDRLRKIVSDESSESEVARATAIVCLGRVGDDADIDFLLSVLQDPDTLIMMRAYSVQALGCLLERGGTAKLGRVAADAAWSRFARGIKWQPIWDLQRLVD